MTDQLTSKSILYEAKAFKGEFLLRTFGAMPQEAGCSPLNVIPHGSNILGVGFGAKFTGDTIADDLSIRVYVRSKLPKSKIPKKEQVPSDINGKPTDVVPVYDLSASARPVEGGSSVGHVEINAGTLGCLVKKTFEDGNDRYILSNNHVLANYNKADIGDNIIEPGNLDGGGTPIATLSEFEPIHVDGKQNFVDCAIAKVINNDDIKPTILTIGKVQKPIIEPVMYQSVRKYGRTTQHTVGIVTDLAADIKVRFGQKLASFEDQLAIQGVSGFFSQPGDSGSLVIDSTTNRPVALLFAGGGAQSFACPIDLVLSRFNVDIL